MTAADRCPRCAKMAKEVAQLRHQVAVERCNATCSIPKRVARWLLLEATAAAGQPFKATHAQIATALYARRAGVSEAAHVLRNDGIITYSRGRVVVRDRARLAAAACDCFPRDRQRTASVASSVVIDDPQPARLSSGGGGL